MAAINQDGDFVFHGAKMMKAQGENPLGLYSTRLRVYRIKRDD
jgi:hypothetical protein